MENSQFEVSGTSAKEVQFKWTIYDFPHSVINGVIPEFDIMLYSDGTIWKIKHVWDRLGVLHHSFARIDLVKTTHPKIVVDVEFKLFNSRGEYLDSLNSIKAEMSSGTIKFSKSKISLTTILHEISHDERVTVSCNLKAFINNHPASISDLLVNSESSVSKSSISDDFAKLRMNGEFSDFTISVCGKEFHVHKNILAARSPVFSTMFKNEMKEANSGKVEIEDIESEVFEEFLNYIYTGKCNINQNAFELLAVADKYDAQDLKAFCENELIKNLSPENCFKTLNLSNIYSAHNLKEEAINFIVSNDRVSDENGLDQITNLSLSKEVIKALVVQKK